MRDDANFESPYIFEKLLLAQYFQIHFTITQYICPDSDGCHRLCSLNIFISWLIYLLKCFYFIVLFTSVVELILGLPHFCFLLNLFTHSLAIKEKLPVKQSSISYILGNFHVQTCISSNNVFWAKVFFPGNDNFEKLV